MTVNDEQSGFELAEELLLFCDGLGLLFDHIVVGLQLAVHQDPVGCADGEHEEVDDGEKVDLSPEGSGDDNLNALLDPEFSDVVVVVDDDGVVALHQRLLDPAPQFVLGDQSLVLHPVDEVPVDGVHPLVLLAERLPLVGRVVVQLQRDVRVPDWDPGATAVVQRVAVVEGQRR